MNFKKFHLIFAINKKSSIFAPNYMLNVYLANENVKGNIPSFLSQKSG